jgi:hypothetical protein
MIRAISDIGRALVIVSALLTVIGGVAVGYAIARSQEYAAFGSFEISGGGKLTPLELFYSLMGLGIGFVVAGAVFGAIATLYEIRDSLNSLAEENSGAHTLVVRQRQEPRIG